MILRAASHISFNLGKRQRSVPMTASNGFIILLGTANWKSNSSMPVGIYLLPSGQIGFCQEPEWLTRHRFAKFV